MAVSPHDSGEDVAVNWKQVVGAADEAAPRDRHHPFNRHPSVAMKQFLSIFLTVLFASAVLIGCGFVDSNSSYVESEEPSQLEVSYIGSFATHDTTGYEDKP